MKNSKIAIALLALVIGSVASAEDDQFATRVSKSVVEPSQIVINIALNGQNRKAVEFGDCYALPTGVIPRGAILANVRIAEDGGWAQASDGSGYHTSEIEGDYVVDGNIQGSVLLGCLNPDHWIQADDYTSSFAPSIQISFVKK